jgi:hypothetical protein
MQAVLQGTPYKEISKSLGISTSRISVLVKRALGGEADEPPLLRKAFIPHRRHRPPVRRSPLSNIEKPIGAQCAFQCLLDTVDGLKEKLDHVLQADLDDKPEAENLTPGSFFSNFLLFLQQANHPKDQYPYTEERLAYESVRRYYHRRRDELEMEQQIKGEQRKRQRVTKPNRQPFYFGREVQLDEHTHNGQSTVYLDFDDHLIPLRVARFSVVVLVDVDTHAALSFFIALTQHPSRFDILQTFETANLFLPKATLHTPGIQCPLEPAFPNNLNEGIARVAFDNVLLDNALAHCADAVEEYVCDRHLATLHLGIPGVPLARRIVEYVNNVIARNARRHKSTTGKNVTDPIKESRKNQKHAPVITLNQLIESIYAFLAKHNQTTMANLGASTPLNLVEHTVENHPVRFLQPTGLTIHSPFRLREKARVKWLRKEGRRPHINFKYVRYQGEALNNASLVGNTVIVEFDYRDIRTLYVYTLDNEFLGTVCAPRSWMKYPHSIKTREHIFKYQRLTNIRLSDPLVEFFWIQLNNKNSSKCAQFAIRLYREFLPDTGMLGIPLPKTWTPSFLESQLPVDANNDQDLLPDSMTSEIPDWDMEFAYGNKSGKYNE